MRSLSLKHCAPNHFTFQSGSIQIVPLMKLGEHTEPFTFQSGSIQMFLPLKNL